MHKPCTIKRYLTVCLLLYSVIFITVLGTSNATQTLPALDTANDSTRILCDSLVKLGFNPTTFHIPDPAAFIEKYKLPSKIHKKIAACFKQAAITSDDIGTLEFCNKLESVGFTLIKKSGFADGKQHHTNVIALCPPSVGSYIIKAEARMDKIKHNSYQNMFRILLAQAIKDHAKKHCLKFIKTPRKYLFHIPNAGKTLIDKNFLVVSKVITIDTSKKISDLSIEQLSELIDLITALWIIDVKFYRPDHPKSSNTVLDSKGRLVFLDTQPLCDMWTSRPINDLISKGFCPVPIEGIVANALMEEGYKQNNKSYIFRGQLILKTIYVLYRELFYLYAMHRNNNDAKKIISEAILKCSHALELVIAQPLPSLDKDAINIKTQKYKAICLQEYLKTKYLLPQSTSKKSLSKDLHD